MQRKVSHRVGSRIAVTLVAGALLLPAGGCESSGLGGLLGSPAAVELLSPVVKEAANAYLGDLAVLGQSLGNINNLSDVLEFVQEAEPTVRQLSSSYQTLSQTTGDERANLLKAFGPKFESANSSFLNQSTKATSNGLWSKALTPLLDQVQLFQ